MSIARLIESGEAVHVAAQNVAEFWAAATRPMAQNGLGLDVAAVSEAVDRIEQVSRCCRTTRRSMSAGSV
ncbi:MAG: hypothetical protein ACREET_13420 [Stellaceae bacterium]